jgi:hypothetical protein
MVVTQLDTTKIRNMSLSDLLLSQEADPSYRTSLETSSPLEDLCATSTRAVRDGGGRGIHKPALVSVFLTYQHLR